MEVREQESAGVRFAERVGDFLTSWVDRVPLPSWLSKILTRELVGFAILGTFTLGVDLVLLAMLQAWTPLPLPVSVSIAYILAFSLNFLLNRAVNFQSHAPVGGQLVKFGFVVVGDYLITLLGTTGLAALGLDFRIARLAASACVALFTYSASRWWVFRDRLPDRTDAEPQEEPSATQASTPFG
jgi:putative flippase GtrA